MPQLQEQLHEVPVLLALMPQERQHEVQQLQHLHDEYVRRFLFPLQKQG
jgi:hypothetical protein